MKRAKGICTLQQRESHRTQARSSHFAYWVRASLCLLRVGWFLTCVCGDPTLRVLLSSRLRGPAATGQLVLTRPRVPLTVAAGAATSSPYLRRWTTLTQAIATVQAATETPRQAEWTAGRTRTRISQACPSPSPPDFHTCALCFPLRRLSPRVSSRATVSAGFLAYRAYTFLVPLYLHLPPPPLPSDIRASGPAHGMDAGRQCDRATRAGRLRRG